jgi:hypothetical protein
MSYFAYHSGGRVLIISGRGANPQRQPPLSFRLLLLKLLKGVVERNTSVDAANDQIVCVRRLADVQVQILLQAQHIYICLHGGIFLLSLIALSYFIERYRR